MIPGGRARKYLHERDPGFAWPKGGLTEGSRLWLFIYQAASVVALLLVIATLLVPRTASSRSEARSLGFGYPLAFVTVDETDWNPPGYPQTYLFDPWEDVASLHGGRFLADWIFWTAALWIPLWVLRRQMRRVP